VILPQPELSRARILHETFAQGDFERRFKTRHKALFHFFRGRHKTCVSGMTFSACFWLLYRYRRTSVQRPADIAVSDVSLYLLQPIQAKQRGTIENETLYGKYLTVNRILRGKVGCASGPKFEECHRQ